jgi:gas vesicle protein
MMKEHNGAVTVGLSLMAGCLIGGIAGVLYAPQSGARTRRQLAGFADDVRERAGELANDTASAIEKAVERGRHVMNA